MNILEFRISSSILTDSRSIIRPILHVGGNKGTTFLLMRSASKTFLSLSDIVFFITFCITVDWESKPTGAFLFLINCWLVVIFYKGWGVGGVTPHSLCPIFSFQPTIFSENLLKRVRPNYSSESFFVRNDLSFVAHGYKILNLFDHPIILYPSVSTVRLQQWHTRSPLPQACGACLVFIFNDVL